MNGEKLIEQITNATQGKKEFRDSLLNFTPTGEGIHEGADDAVRRLYKKPPTETDDFRFDGSYKRELLREVNRK